MHQWTKDAFKDLLDRLEPVSDELKAEKNTRTKCFADFHDTLSNMAQGLLNQIQRGNALNLQQYRLTSSNLNKLRGQHSADPRRL